MIPDSLHCLNFTNGRLANERSLTTSAGEWIIGVHNRFLTFRGVLQSSIKDFQRHVQVLSRKCRKMLMTLKNILRGELLSFALSRLILG